MKKILYFCVTLVCTLSFLTSCNSCSKEPVVPEEKNDTTVVNDSSINMENIVSADREYMFLNFGKDYFWYETSIILKDFLDSEDCDGSIEKITNVFQSVDGEEGRGFVTRVILVSHSPEGTDTIDIKDGFWIEDYDMSESEVTVTYEEAFQRLQEANVPKPHSRNCVLREQVGPKKANPQYIFGNIHDQVYVDAATGAVSKINPAFGN